MLVAGVQRVQFSYSVHACEEEQKQDREFVCKLRSLASFSVCVVGEVSLTGLNMAERSFVPLITGWGLSQASSSEQPPDLYDAEDFQLTAGENKERFGPPVSEKAIDQAISQRIPEKTRRTTMWVVSVFRSWCNARGVAENLHHLGVDKLADLLPRFIMEARRQDKSPYPPNTLVMLIAGIQRYLRENGNPSLSILGDTDAHFARTRSALDARMKQLTKEGVGTVRKQAEPLSREQEDLLWAEGIFSVSTGWGLTYAVFWYNCKLFGMRGADEHRTLTCEQFDVGSDRTGRFLRFMGRNFKNVQGGLKQRKVQCKDLKIYARPELGDRCVVELFSLYFRLIPETGPLYRKPIGNNPPKFSKQVIGKNKLGGLVKEMCARAGFTGNYTNHSGKVTCATELFSHNVDEQLIMRQTGHRSNAVRAYKRPGTDHDKLVSSILVPSPKIPKREPLAECSKPPQTDNILVSPTESQCTVQQGCCVTPVREIRQYQPLQGQCKTPAPPNENGFSLPGGIVLNFNFGKSS